MAHTDLWQRKQPKGTPVLPRYAFYDAPPEGIGSDTEYSAFRVFCLAIGLDLLDAGFSQLEVAFLIRHIWDFPDPKQRLRDFSLVVRPTPPPRICHPCRRRPY